MITSIVNYKKNLRTEATHIASNHVIISDAPIDNMGKGEAFSPTDCCATSLAMCGLTIMGIYLQHKPYEFIVARAEVEKIMGVNPRRIVRINVDYFLQMSEELSELESQKLFQAAKSCPVAHSLHPDIEQNITFHFEHNY